MRILLFAGTTEGRVLAERLAATSATATICVATEYGRDLLSGLPDGFRVHAGRLDAAGMEDLMCAGSWDVVVDATHPYAIAASENIRAAAESVGLPRLRLARAESEEADCLYVASPAEAVERLRDTDGNILLATGSKDLAVYAALPRFAERAYPRVLPMVEAIGECERLGYLRGHVVAMQGPFSRELNAAIMRQFAIRFLVTKDGGIEGGFSEKILAAGDAGARALVIGRPREIDGLGVEAVLGKIAGMAGMKP